MSRRTIAAAALLAGVAVLLGIRSGWAAEVARDLQVPRAWIDGAKREARVIVYGSETPPEMAVIQRAFNHRYPFIAVEFTKAPTVVRFEKVLFSAKQGRPVVDLVTAISGNEGAYVDSGVLMDLHDLPAWQSYPSEYKLHGRYLAGPFLRHWSLAYNTDLVPHNEVPASWEDLLKPKWKGKVAANSITRAVTFIPLWYRWGAQKAGKFLEGLVSNGLVVRKEGHNASLKLLEAGEYSLLITAGEYQVYGDQKKGAPVEWVALDPVPTTTPGILGAMKDAPHPNALRIYVNWLMSEEGQRAYALATKAFPIHPKLAAMTPNFKDWPKRMAGKHEAVLALQNEYESTRAGGGAVKKAWNRLVLKGL